MLKVHRTHRAKIRNHGQVEDPPDRHGWSASKLWNVLRLRLRARETESHDITNYHSRQVWEKTDKIPDHGDLKDELKIHPKYKGLHSQSNPVSAFLRNSLKSSTCGTKRGSLTLVRIRPATARKTTSTNRGVASTKNTHVRR